MGDAAREGAASVREQGDPHLEHVEATAEGGRDARRVGPPARSSPCPRRDSSRRRRSSRRDGALRGRGCSRRARRHTATCGRPGSPSRRARFLQSRGRRSSARTAGPPYAASTWNQSPKRSQTAASSGRGSIEPVPVVPAVPTTAIGRAPAPRSAVIRASSASGPHPEGAVDRDPPHRGGAETEDVRGPTRSCRAPLRSCRP